MRHFLFFLLTLSLTACGLPQPGAEAPTCASVSKRFVTDTLAILTEWQDATELADSTSRIALSPVISQLQGIRRKAEDLKTPDCAVNVHDALTTFMDTEIRMYLSFMSQQPDSEGDYPTLNRRATTELGDFVTLFSVLRK